MDPSPAPAPGSPQPPSPSAKRVSTPLVLILILGGGGLFACCVLSVVAGIAVPNFIRFQARAKQVECKSQLAMVAMAQQTHFETSDDFAETFEDLGVDPEAQFYSYFMGEDSTRSATRGDPPTEDALPALLGGRLPGVYGECPSDCEVVIACAGNIDSDPTLDVWSVSSKARTPPGAPGNLAEAWELFHDQDDVTK